MSNKISRTFVHQHVKVGSIIRQADWKVLRDEDDARGVAVVRGSRREVVRYLGDFDFPFEDRARRTHGWKNKKFRHQWEHLLAEQDRHEKSRRRKMGGVAN